MIVKHQKMGSRKQMIKVISNFLNKNATWNSILILLGLIIIFNLLIFPFAYKTSQNIIPLDLQFSYSSEKAYDILANYSDEGLKEYVIAELTVDLIFPLIYALFLSFFLFKLTKKSILSLFPLLIILSDYAENIGIAVIIHYLPHKLPNLVGLTSLFTSLKWVLIAISILLILVALVAKLFNQKKKV